MNYSDDLTFAKNMDQEDPLRSFRERFHIPLDKDHNPLVYLCGNSLGLQPKDLKNALGQELEDWKNLGVEGHTQAARPWLPYHEFLTTSMASVVGAKPIEVVVMNTLTVNLHLMMVSFYRPQGKRTKVLIESDAFPSDKYAVSSQIQFHKLDPTECLIELKPRDGEYCLRESDIRRVIEQRGEEIALIMLGNTNYYTGQFFNMKKITEWGHAKGCMVGFDCAHGVGNVPLQLHDTDCDFAVWCTYKYLNSGPGSLGGAFVHERHSKDKTLPRFAGWWGHNKETRFNMRDSFDPIQGVEAWQLSNPPILSMVAILTSLKIFQEAGMDKIREKSIKLTGYLEYLMNQLGTNILNVITPTNPKERGCQLSLKMQKGDKDVFDKISERGVIADWREPNVIRISPVPLYNSYEDVYRFYSILKEAIER